MRFKELFDSDYNQDLRSEVITLLTAVSAEGVDEIHTANLLNDLENQGYAVDEESLLDLLSDMEIVSLATSDKITIATSDVDAMVGDEVGGIEADRVDNLATDQATKDIGEEAVDPYEILSPARIAAPFKKMSTAKLMSLTHFGLGKEREHANAELERRDAEGGNAHDIRDE